MKHTLNTPQQQWVDRTLAGLSLEQAIAQLVNITRPMDDPDAWRRLLDQWPAGCISLRTKTADAYRTVVRAVQEHSAIPLLVVANM
ncbi:MAG: hypothetical protein KDE24_11265, partial [Caldilinea sp.]|nr:hypothetical protein [Caldilinea sp.]